MKLVFRSSTLALLNVVALLWMSGCGGTAEDEARRVQSTSVIANEEPVQRYVIHESEIERDARGSARRAFLRYWSNLQLQHWEEAARTFEPGLRRYIGLDTITRALANHGSAYRASRPSIVSVTRRGGRAVIRYLRIGTGATEPASVSWVRDVGGRWLISYDPLLDQALANLRQLETQLSIDPLAQKLLPAAIRAGNRARQLQSEYAKRRDHGGASSP